VALYVNIRLGCNVLPRANTLVYRYLLHITYVKSFITLGPGDNLQTLFTDKGAKYVRVVILAKPLQSSLILVNKAGAYPSEEFNLLELPTNIRPGQKSFKTFTSVIY
jgi:hypothetical protein